MPEPGLDAEGRPVAALAEKYIQLLDVVSAKARPKLMPTIESSEDMLVRGRLALHIQEASERSAEADGSAVVHDDADPLWVSWNDLGPFPSVRRSLTWFIGAQPSLEHPECTVLSSPKEVGADLQLTDPDCPTLCILDELIRRGWNPHRGRVVHTKDAPKDMDGRESIKMKSYYVVLLDVERCLELASHIPSDEPLLFYKLLLEGREVEPGLGHKAYSQILNNEDPTPAAIEDEVLQEEFLK